MTMIDCVEKKDDCLINLHTREDCRTGDMNEILLWIVLPLAALYFILYGKFIWRMHTMSTEQFNIIRGGLNRKPTVFLWALTFTLSSIGGILTFYLHVKFTTDSNIYPAFIFGALDISFILWIYAVESYNLKLVRACLWTNVFGYIMLFVYSIVTFHVDDVVVDNPALLYVTHIFNAVAIFHVVVMDLIIWWNGWVENF